MILKKTMTILVAVTGMANADCFIAKENGKIVKQSGECDRRYSPFSTFKIAISLMGYDAGILKSTKEPSIDFSGEIKERVGSPNSFPIQMLWQRAQTPETWMKYSVVWYSQEITKKLGMDKFKDYVQKFKYGNLDVSGNPGKADGLTNAWLGASLEISALEQVEFLEMLSKRQLAVSKQAQENTIKLIAQEDMWDDWKLFGKTGGGTMGWFVGWIEKGDRTIIFAQHIEKNTSPITAGRLAKEMAKDQLVSLIISQN